MEPEDVDLWKLGGCILAVIFGIALLAGMIYLYSYLH